MVIKILYKRSLASCFSMSYSMLSLPSSALSLSCTFLFRLFAWRQGDARFVIEARRRKPFELKQMTQDTAVFETEVPLHNAGRQLGTIMDFYPRTLLPREQYDKVIVHSQLANKAAERDDNYWESVIFNPGDKGMIRVTIALVSKDGNIREDLKTFPDMPIDLVYQVVSQRMVHP